MAEGVTLPVVGKIGRGWLIGTGGAAAGLGLLWWRKRNAAAQAQAAAAPADTGTGDGIDPATGYPDGSGQDQAALAAQDGGYGTGYGGGGYGGYGGYNYNTGPAAIDPATGVPYADEAGYQYNSTTGTWQQLGGATGTGTSAGGYATNAAWAQAAESYLTSIGVSASAARNAIGAVLSGMPVTPDERKTWDEAVAFLGAPPQSFPPIHAGHPGGTGHGKGIRHVATGSESLDQVAAARHTSAAHIEAVTLAAPLSAANRARFAKYVATGAGKPMPKGLVYYTST